MRLALLVALWFLVEALGNAMPDILAWARRRGGVVYVLTCAAIVADAAASFGAAILCALWYAGAISL